MSSDDTTSSSSISEECSPAVDILAFGCSFEYTIPSFSVLTVNLRHAVVQGLDEESGHYKLADVFFRDSSLQALNPPFTEDVYKACFVDVRKVAIRTGV